MIWVLSFVKVSRLVNCVSKPHLRVTMQVLGMIMRTITSRSKDILIPSYMYKSLVRPHLDFCIQAWRPHLIKDIQSSQ